jgi:uncharacterized oligopeptide transporter (OPT) family protein
MVDAFVNAMLGVAAVIGVAIVVAVLIGFPVKWMMNYLFTPTFLRATFGVSQMTFWRAFWLFILAGFLFGSAGIRMGLGR